MTSDLKLAIDDSEFGPKIRETRITVPDERTIAMRITRVRERMEARGEYDEFSKKGKKNRAKLELIPERPAELLDLEQEYLSREERERDGLWPASAPSGFLVLDEAVHIASFVINTYRTDLRRFKIAIVMAEKIPPTDRRGRLGTASKLPGKMKYLTTYDGLITLDYGIWSMLTDRDRQRLIHHELEHLEVGEENQLLKRPHDFEEFVSVVDIYGLQSQSERFSTDGHVARALARGAAQLELLSA